MRGEVSQIAKWAIYPATSVERSGSSAVNRWADTDHAVTACQVAADAVDFCGVDKVTPDEIARMLGVTGPTFRNWLRSEKRAGHRLLASHEKHAHYRFDRAEADQLLAEYRDSGSRVRVPGQSYPGTASNGVLRSTDMPPALSRRRAQGAARPRSAEQAPKASDDPFHGLMFSADPGHRVTAPWLGEQVVTLADLLRPGLRVVVVGINPSPVSVAAGHYYRGQVGQRFLRRLAAAGVLDLSPERFEDDQGYEQGSGFTDAVKRPTARAHGLRAGELGDGRELLEARLQAAGVPRVVFTFKKAAIALLGSFDRHGVIAGATLGGAEVFVMPGPMERTDRVDRALRDLQAWWRD